MSDNPLETNPERDAEIKARATAMWEEAGRPDGKMDEYMERADELVRMELAGKPGQLPNPMDDPSPVPGVIVEEASIQENLGELPGARGLPDQGEWRETPMTREKLNHGGEEQPPRADSPEA